MTVKQLILTVGLPRAGKSTWARRQSVPVVSPDAIRLAMHGQRFAAEAEPFVWAVAKVMVRALFVAGHGMVILDATNVVRARRDEWRSAEWATWYAPFDTPADVCKARAVATDQLDLLPVIDRMAAGFEPLGSDEPVWPKGPL